METVTIRSEKLKVELLTYGAIIKRIELSGKNLVASLRNDEDYLNDTCYFGATLGRCANRASELNVIDGTEYKLSLNENGVNHLHGGFRGFNKQEFSVVRQSENTVTLSYCSADGEEGYPGDLDVSVTYTALENALIINYRAETNKPTWVSLSNHTYFMPNGSGAGDVFGIPVAIFAENVSEYDSNRRVIGKASVMGTPYDFRAPRPIETEYDSNFYVSASETKCFLNKNLNKAAEIYGDTVITVYTDMPCVQFYTGNFLPDNTPLSCGEYIGKNGALCMETQLEPNFQSRGENILRPGEVYNHTTVFEFDK